MRHLVDHRKLGRTASHRKALLRNLVTSLILHERIETTLPKAKELRRLADRMITWGKQGDLAARREAARVLQSPDALHKLFDGLAKRFEARAGGYTRVLHYGQRRGDAASMAAVEYLGYELPKLEEKKPEKKKAESKRPVEKKPVVEKKAAVKADAKKAEGKKVEAKKAEKKEKAKTEPKKSRWSLLGRKKKED